MERGQKRRREWGEDLEDEYFAEPDAQASNGITWENAFPGAKSDYRLKGLRKIAQGKTVIGKVNWIHSRGLLTTGSGTRSYLPFMIEDRSGEMPVTAWHEVAVPLFNIIEEGQFVKLIGSKVERKRNKADGHEFQITVGRGSKVEVCVKLGEICVVDPSVPMQVQISYLKKPHTCASITLDVKMLVSEGVQCSQAGVQYVHFIGSDGTGEISCIIYEPHSAKIGHRIKEGTRVQLENVAVKQINPEYQSHCNHPLEIGVFTEARIKILEESTRTCPSTQTVAATPASSCPTAGGSRPRTPTLQRPSNVMERPIQENVQVKLENVVESNVDRSIAPPCENDVEINTCKEGRVTKLDPIHDSYGRFYTKDYDCNYNLDDEFTEPTEAKYSDAPTADEVSAEAKDANVSIMNEGVALSLPSPTFERVSPVVGQPGIFLTVRYVVTPQTAKSFLYDMPYFTFVGEVGGNYITCTVYDSNSTLIRPIEVGARVKVFNHELVHIDDRYPLLCDNPHQIVVFNPSNIKVVNYGERTAQKFYLATFDGLADLQVYDFVDADVIVARVECDKGVVNIWRLMVMDVNKYLIPIIIAGSEEIFSSFLIGNIVHCSDLQFRIIRGKSQLHFIDGKSKIERKSVDEAR
ncbi:uncharacterized protein LOC107042974 [Diachasma alloeum]|uniref:uncharacterized protein LOC107042974 n=1 Tax=Diachasma alloeum TaxID=454923 RepID=UPI0007382E5A|nr:uncharacterized protein LOC107042974 [Diachasma alloeum]